MTLCERIATLDSSRREISNWNTTYWERQEIGEFELHWDKRPPALYMRSDADGDYGRNFSVSHHTLERTMACVCIRIGRNFPLAHV